MLNVKINVYLSIEESNLVSFKKQLFYITKWKIFLKQYIWYKSEMLSYKRIEYLDHLAEQVDEEIELSDGLTTHQKIAISFIW